MNRVLQNIPLSVDPSSKDQPHINRQLTEAIRQLWERMNKVEKKVDIIAVDSDIDLSYIDNFIALQDQQKRITVADSPYTLLTTDRALDCDTDGGAITVNFYAGVDKAKATLRNCGTSGNDIRAVPSGTNLIFGTNATFNIIDGEVFDFQYETTEGWR